MLVRRQMLRSALAGIPLALGVEPSRSAFAQGEAWPSRPVRIVVAWAPGGAVDTIARRLAQKLSEGLGKPVIVENKSGATGTIGAAEVARATPDGHTLLAMDNTYAMLPYLFQRLPFDHANAFRPVTVSADRRSFSGARAARPARHRDDLPLAGGPRAQALFTEFRVFISELDFPAPVAEITFGILADHDAVHGRIVTDIILEFLVQQLPHIIGVQRRAECLVEFDDVAFDRVSEGTLVKGGGCFLDMDGALVVDQELRVCALEPLRETGLVNARRRFEHRPVFLPVRRCRGRKQEKD